MRLHGDRRYADDPAIVGGMPVWIALPSLSLQLKKIIPPKNVLTAILVCLSRKAQSPASYETGRRIRQTDHLFVDTSGGHTVESVLKNGGKGQAIAENLMEMSTFCVPIISILIGEGGSGGALFWATADRVWMLQMPVLFRYFTGGMCQYSLERRPKAAIAATSLN